MLCKHSERWGRYQLVKIPLDYYIDFMKISRIIIFNLSSLYSLCSPPLQFIEVQPNDGFGTLLPEETLEIDLIFSPNKAKVYNFQLNCKTEINRLACDPVL